MHGGVYNFACKCSSPCAHVPSVGFGYPCAWWVIMGLLPKSSAIVAITFVDGGELWLTDFPNLSYIGGSLRP